MAYLYILQGTRGFYYCGITNDILKRYLAHNTGKSRSTRNNFPYVIKYLTAVDSMSRARVIEKLIKNQGVKKWLIKSSGTIHGHFSRKTIEEFYFSFHRSN